MRHLHTLNVRRFRMFDVPKSSLACASAKSFWVVQRSGKVLWLRVITRTQEWETYKVVTNCKRGFVTRQLGLMSYFVFRIIKHSKMFDEYVEQHEQTWNHFCCLTVKCTKRWLFNLWEGSWLPDTCDICSVWVLYKADVCYSDTSLSAPTSRRMWSTQLVRND